MTSSFQEDLAVPLAIFELYGALDLIVQANPELGPRIDEYMPGASANQGWSQALYDFFLSDAGGRINDVGESVRSGLVRTMAIASSQGVGEEPPFTIPDLSNLVYAVGTLSHFPEMGLGDELHELYVQVLSLAVPEGIDDRIEVAEALLANLQENFWGWDAWADFIKEAANLGLVMELVAKVPQCRTGVVTVNGYESVLIDADIESDVVTFNNLIDVIDPRNWPLSYPSFFCKMEDAAVRGDKWYDIKETVGFCKVTGGYKLVTKLRFLKSNQKPRDARLDFDLGEDQTGCSGLVKVDKGFVNALCTNPNNNPAEGGVLLRTRKIAHITGIPAYAQAVLLCKLGYGWAAVHTFFGPAMQPGPLAGYTYWNTQPLKTEDPNVLETGPGDGSATTTQSTGTPTTPPLQVATKTAETLKETAEFLTDKHLEITRKWLANQLNFGDLAVYGAQIGAKLGSEPWKWLHKIVTPTAPSGSSTGSKGSGSTP